MTSINQPDTFGKLEDEYAKMKRDLYQKFFLSLMVLFAAVCLHEASRTISASKPFSLIPLCVLIIAYYSFKKYIWKREDAKEKMITLFLLFCYTIALWRNYRGNKSNFDSPFDAFYISYCIAQLEGIIMSRVPRLDYRTFFVVIATVLRVLFIPMNNKGLAVMQFVFMGIRIYLDVDKENHDKKLFKGYYNSKQQLLSFKNLIVDDTFQGVAIVTQDLSRYLFTNKYFQDLLGHGNDNDNVKEEFSKFSLHKGFGNNKGQTQSQSLEQRNPETLLTILHEKFSRQDMHLNKMVCLFNYNSLLSKNSSPKLISAFLRSFTWDGQAAVAVILRDVTEQHMIWSLKIADAQKDMMLATVSHELRTPLNGILGMIQIIEKKALDNDTQHYLNICKTSGNLLLSLVNSILDLNQIRANKLKLNPERVDIYPLLRGISSLFEFQSKMKNIELKVKVSPSVSPCIVTDKQRLSQILINLLGNALKFTSKGCIQILADRHQNCVRFSVSDTGTGIKEEDQEKLFKMFGKLDQDDQHLNKQGVGLGLTISDSIARVLCNSEQLKGITVKSVYGEGSTFSFLVSNIPGNHEILSQALPSRSSSGTMLMESSSILSMGSFDEISSYNPTAYTIDPKFISKIETTNTIPIQQASSLETKNALLKKNSIHGKDPRCILLVDDNMFNITVAEHFVKSLGYKAKGIFSGAEAVDFLQKNPHKKEPISLILMDCQMPGMDGYEATRLIKKKMMSKEIPEIPIVALTADHSDANKKACREAGMCDYLTKPLKEDQLLMMIRKYVVS